MQISLVILAAGLGSRFKGGSKQTAQVGPHGEMIMEYSIHDAIEAGFEKVIFVIRKDMQEDFKKMIDSIYRGDLNVEYVFQELEDIPIQVDYERQKPWGTAHAIYSLRNAITGPFAVINADDYYGKDAFQKMYQFLKNDCDSNHYAMVGYPLKNTLSLNGSVNRGICEVEGSKLKSICEVFHISLENGSLKNEQNLPISMDSICSMGFYGFHPSIFEDLEEKLIEFLRDSNDKSEFIIPSYLEERRKCGISIEVLPSESKWVGITYMEDLENTRKYFLSLHENDIYPDNL